MLIISTNSSSAQDRFTKNKNKLNFTDFCSFASTKNSGAYAIRKYSRAA